MLMEISLYFLVLTIVGMVVFKVCYGLYNLIWHRSVDESVVKGIQIEKIIGGLKCPKNFVCVKQELDVLSKVEESSRESLLKCLEGKVKECTFTDSCESKPFCKCPLRAYILKEKARK